MKIGILGVGNIGATLALSLCSAGHEVKVANSRGPHTIDADVLATGATATDSSGVFEVVDVVVLSIPLNRIPDVAPLASGAAADTVIIDTSNYYPSRDQRIEAIEDGQIESLWVREQLGRPVVKAWNAIGAASFAMKGSASGAPDRIAIPVAGDDPEHVRIGVELVDATGFDGFDSGPLEKSWRQQPGTPCYCTDLTANEMAAALDAADAARSPKRRDIAGAAFAERMENATAAPDAEYLVRLNRVLYM